MNASTGSVIETHGLTKTYRGVQALKSLDLQVHQHSICGFLGPNGAGKTTTLPSGALAGKSFGRT
jgi:ABC-type multidrug transport system ATPase subunit